MDGPPAHLHFSRRRRAGNADSSTAPTPALLATIGYEGASLDAFLRTLQRARIDCVVDIRELPLSRRPGFSRTPLRAALGQLGIAYRHERGLGAPRALRQALRRDADLGRFFSGYRRHLRARRALVARLAAELRGRVALLCYERDPARCHRSLVAEALRRRWRIPCRHLFA